jgi:hypothetical protein
MIRKAPWLLLSLAPLALAACSKSSEAPAPTPSASAAPAASSAPPAPTASTPLYDKNRERGPGRGGIDAMLFRAARDLPLDAAARAKVDALGDKMHDRDTAPRDAMKTFATDLAGQVRAGKIDASKLQPDEAAFDQAMKTMLVKQANALGGLHDALDAGQRKALADAVTTGAAKREAEAKMREGDAGDWVAHKLTRMTTDLGLDAGQQKQVAALLAKQPSPAAMRDDMKKVLSAVLAAFQAGTFDATTALQPTLKGPHDALDQQIAFTTQLLPVLHADQREKLATSTTRPAGRGETWSDEDDGHGGGGGNGGGNGGGGNE